MPILLTDREKQQHFSFIEDCLLRLSILDPNVLCAGGAPRDLFLNREPKDFDFFLSVTDHYPADRLVKNIAVLLGVEEAQVTRLGGTYRRAIQDRTFRGVYQLPLQGRIVEVIVLGNSLPLDHVFSFPCELSFGHINLVSLTSDQPVRNDRVLLSVLNRGYATIREDIAPDYLDRMQRKFPDLRFLTQREAMNRELQEGGQALEGANVPGENRMVYGA